MRYGLTRILTTVMSVRQAERNTQMSRSEALITEEVCSLVARGVMDYAAVSHYACAGWVRLAHFSEVMAVELSTLMTPSEYTVQLREGIATWRENLSDPEASLPETEANEAPSGVDAVIEVNDESQEQTLASMGW